MRPPDFWKKDGPLSRVLDPVGRLVAGAGELRRNWTTAQRAAVPVLCIGNLTAGGTGKTPVAMDLAARLANLGAQPVYLTRGYGGKLAGPVVVDPHTHDAIAVGDEALLLAATGPTVVATDRQAGAALAVDIGADVIVMDDGFQNPSLVKDLSLLVVDGPAGFGNGRLLPAGPLREPVEAGLARADAVVLIGGGSATTRFQLRTRPTLDASLVPAPGNPDVRDLPVLAFAGIGRPEKFFDSLAAAGAVLVETHPFPDHHQFRPEEIDRLAARAAELDCQLITTEKDWVRLPADLPVLVFRIEIAWRDTHALDRLLTRLLQQRTDPTDAQ